MLAVLPIEPAPEDRSFIFVKPIGPTSQRAGWIAYASTAMSLTANHLSDRGWNSTAVSGMPILVQRLPEAQREDWRRLTKAIADAEKEGVFVPDAYVARAELWTIAGDASKAVEDFRRAADTALQAGRSPSEQSAYLRLLRDALARFEQAPRPAEGARGNDYESAAAHFGAGCRLFWNQSFLEAEHHFESAIALNPQDPLYWYFRGLTRRQIGNLWGSQHDALIGAFLERSRYRDLEIGRALRRVQGPDRAWLDRYRLGDPSQQLLQLELTGVTIRPGVSP
jgi:tetratricopeptide (TPR) repeat protein